MKQHDSGRVIKVAIADDHALVRSVRLEIFCLHQKRCRQFFFRRLIEQNLQVLKSHDHSTISRAERTGKTVRNHGVGKIDGPEAGAGNTHLSLPHANILCFGMLFNRNRSAY